MKYKYYLILLAILTTMDFYVTRIIVGSDLFLELNGMAKLVLTSYGYIGLAAFKAVPIIILGILLYNLQKESKAVKAMLVLAIVFYLIVVIPGVLIIV